MSVVLPIDYSSARALVRPPRVAPRTIALLAIAAAGVLLRFGQFGNPIAGLDEQFYLLVGDRMWQGELPYVDLWDRKPVGLFLLFAAIRLLPGDGVLAAQLVACASAIATGWLVATIARRWVGWPAAAMAAIVYLAGLNELWGDTSQTPVFYNLPTAAAALLVLPAADRPGGVAARRAGMAAMALVGLAVQIKTNAAIEGALFGGWLLRAEWRATHDPGRTVRRGAELLLIAAVPTLAAAAGYALLGRFDAWWQANVLSVLAKGRPGDPAAIGTLAESVLLATPVLLLALLGLWARTRRFTRWRADTGFLIGWTLLATADFGALGGYFPHYALPLLLACSCLIASAFALRRVGPWLFALAMAWPLVHALAINPRAGAKERAIAAQVVAALPRDVRTRCLFMFQGPVIYYHLTQACRVTRFAFTAHLSSGRESRALGVDAAVALDAAMARHPGTVITVAHSTWQDRNPAIERRLAARLARDYRPVAWLPTRSFFPDERLVIWRRNGF